MTERKPPWANLQRGLKAQHRVDWDARPSPPRRSSTTSPEMLHFITVGVERTMAKLKRLTRIATIRDSERARLQERKEAEGINLQSKHAVLGFNKPD